MNPKRIRLDAQIAGEKYYQGKPCKYGHDGLRYTSNAKCILCSSKQPETRIGRFDAIEARKKAAALGEVTYTSNHPCVAGHFVRYVCNAVCVECTKLRNEQYRKADPERAARYGREWREKNREYYLAYAKAHYQPKPRKPKQAIDLSEKAAELQRRRERNAQKRAQSCSL